MGNSYSSYLKNTLLAFLIIIICGCRLFPGSSDEAGIVSQSARIYTTTLSNMVYKCDVADDFTSVDCTNSGNTGDAFDYTLAIVFNADATFAYVVEYNLNKISVCPVNSDGSFGNCTRSGNGLNLPFGLALNSEGTKLYVVNNDSNSVSICPVNPDGSLGICADSGSGAIFSQPTGITFNPSENFAYISNSLNSTVNVCEVDGSGNLGSCVITGTGFSNPEMGTSNKAGTRFYVADSSNATIRVCSINAFDGTLSACAASASTGEPLNFPRSIVFNDDETIAFIADQNNILSCTVDSDTGALGECVVAATIAGNSGGMYFIL